MEISKKSCIKDLEKEEDWFEQIAMGVKSYQQMGTEKENTLLGITDLKEEDTWLNEIVWKLKLNVIEDNWRAMREVVMPTHDQGPDDDALDEKWNLPHEGKSE